MLKFNYDKQGIILETVTDPIEEVVNRRVLLAVRTAQPIHLQPSFISLVVPSEVPELGILEAELAQIDCDTVFSCAMLPNPLTKQTQPLDNVRRDIEVIMRGVWLTHHPETEEGLFLTSLTSTIEKQIEELWTYQPTASS